MKQISFILAGFLIFTSCNSEEKQENERLREENQNLKQEASYQDSTINDFTEVFSRVQNNLDSIRKREESIRKIRTGGPEGIPDVKEQILADIEAINELLEENEAAIKKLNQQLSGKDSKIYRLNKLVDNLNRQITEKNDQISLLKQDLASANFKMEQLNSRVGNLKEEKMAQQKTIEEQEEQLNTAFYAVGTAKELEENKVIDKEGGFIGIGRTKTLAEDFNRDYFTQINIAKTSAIPLDLDGDDVKLITNHPSSSYQWVKSGDDITALKITQAEEFWKSSRYLVLVVK